MQYTSLFHRGVHAVPSSIQGVAPLASQGLVPPSLDGTVPDTYRSPPRPLPYDADPRCTHLQRGPVSRFEKASSHFHEEEEPLRRSNSNAEPEALGVVEKWNGSDHEGGSKESRSGYPSRKMISGAAYILSSTEDEDVCPTCLEGTLHFPKELFHVYGTYVCVVIRFEFDDWLALGCLCG